MGLEANKNKARSVLASRDREALLAWSRSVRDPFRVLISLTYDSDELLRWRAIEATGWVAATYADSRRDKLKDTIRRLLWLMNDESGGLGWHAPELIGEILCSNPGLIPEYAPVLPSFLREEPFERGTHFAIWRIASVDPASLSGSVGQLVLSLSDADPFIRCVAGLALLAIRTEPSDHEIEQLRNDSAPFCLYDLGSGQMRKTTVQEEASRASLKVQL